jgi:hypothetical protein
VPTDLVMSLASWVVAIGLLYLFASERLENGRCRELATNVRRLRQRRGGRSRRSGDGLALLGLLHQCQLEGELP